jgi:hypothetical protein
MNNVLGATQQLHRFRAKQPVRIGNNTNNHQSSFAQTAQIGFWLANG